MRILLRNLSPTKHAKENKAKIISEQDRQRIRFFLTSNPQHRQQFLIGENQVYVVSQRKIVNSHKCT